LIKLELQASAETEGTKAEEWDVAEEYSE